MEMLGSGFNALGCFADNGAQGLGSNRPTSGNSGTFD